MTSRWCASKAAWLLSHFNGCYLGTGPDSKSAWSFLLLEWWVSQPAWFTVDFCQPVPCTVYIMVHPEWYATDANVESLWKWTFTLTNSHKVFMRVITPFIWHLCEAWFRDGDNSFSAASFTVFTDWSFKNLLDKYEKQTQFLKDLVNANGNRIIFQLHNRKDAHCIYTLSLLFKVIIMVLFT